MGFSSEMVKNGLKHLNLWLFIDSGLILDGDTSVPLGTLLSVFGDKVPTLTSDHPGMPTLSDHTLF